MIYKTLDDSLYKLNHKNNKINFEFTAINFKAPSQIRFKYQLIGYDKTPSQISSKRTANYTKLPPGKYTFKVWACNESELWNDIPAEKYFEIVPSIWQRTSFKIFSFLFIIVFIGLLVFFIARAYYKRKHTLEKMTDLQFNSLTNQLYPHFLFNAIANISNSIYLNDKNTAYDYTAKLTNLIREVQNDKEKFYKTLREELDFVRSYLEIQTFRFKDRFIYEINIDENINLEMKIPQMTLQSFVENAVKHGLEHLKKDGLLLISATKKNKLILFSIEDNGIGIENAKKLKTPGTGKGMRIISEIIDLYNKNFKTNISFKIIDLYKNGGKGTRIEIIVPTK